MVLPSIFQERQRQGTIDIGRKVDRFETLDQTDRPVLCICLSSACRAGCRMVGRDPASGELARCKMEFGWHIAAGDPEP